jgi:hypothetical protein
LVICKAWGSPNLVLQISYAGLDLPGSATAILSHLCSAAAATACFAIVSATYGPCSRSPPLLFLICRCPAQPLCCADLLPQWQTSRHAVFPHIHIPHVPLCINDIISITTASGAHFDGLANACAAPWQHVLAGLFQLLSSSSSHTGPGADAGAGLSAMLCMPALDAEKI